MNKFKLMCIFSPFRRSLYNFPGIRLMYLAKIGGDSSPCPYIFRHPGKGLFEKNALLISMST